jgi:tRNA (cmo5U34)-methyltransferase
MLSMRDGDEPVKRGSGHRTSSPATMVSVEATATDPTAGGGWDEPARAVEYLGRIADLLPRAQGEAALRDALPARPRSVLDLGCGDGRLAAFVLDARPSITRAEAIDRSPPMLERAAERFRLDGRVRVSQWDLNDSIEAFGTFDLIVSGFAIHHLEDERKRDLFAEVSHQLEPGGWFFNLEVTKSSTPALHERFLAAIGRTEDDPEDRLVSAGIQAEWMRGAGLTDVHCLWRWRGFALLAGRARAW